MQKPVGMPLYAYIKRELKNQIESGSLPEGARVPSEFELARDYNVSRNPTRQALRDLEMEGYIIRTPGRGSFVAPASQRQRLLSITGWHTLAILCPEMEFRYTRSVIQGFVQYAATQNFHAMAYFTLFAADNEASFLADLRNSGIEGLALWIQHETDDLRNLLTQFQSVGFPYVLIDRYIESLPSDFVVTDNHAVMYQLTRELIARGHSRIAFISPELDNTAARDRLNGYRSALRDSEIAEASCKEIIVHNGDDSSEVTAIIRSLLSAKMERPTAFVCVNDGIAGKLLDILSDMGLAVPADAEIALVDDNNLRDVAGVPLLAAAQNGYDMGQACAESLISRIADPALAPRGQYLGCNYFLA
jgi:DNA-binding LacI/PurR family transcriptional regulator